jgi:hypothetical protein
MGSKECQLSKVTINLEILFQGLVYVLRLSIAFQMVSQSKVQLHIQGLFERTEETRHEFRAPVRSDVRWNSMLGKYMDDEQFGQLSGGDSIMSQNKESLLSEMVYHYPDSSETSRVR